MKRANNQNDKKLLLGLILITLLSFGVLSDSLKLYKQVSAGGTPELDFSNSSYEVDEDVALDVFTVTVTIDISPTTEVKVDYITVAGDGAVASVDYTDVSGTLTFPVGDDSSQTFTIPIIDDSVYDPDETVNVLLFNAENATLDGGESSLTVVLTIDDDESAPTATPTSTSSDTSIIYADSFEPNNTFNDATDWVATRGCDFTLWPIGDEDYFSFFAKAGSRYRVFTDDLDAGLDTVLTVYDPSGNTVEVNDDFEETDRRSEVEFNADTNGFYFARIINQDPTDPTDKTYCFEVQETDPLTSTPTATPVAGDDCEYNSTIEFACLIAVGETKSANFVPVLGSDQDTDIYRLWVKAGIEYSCETLNLSAYADTNMILWDQNGNPFNPWIGNDDKENESDTPEFGSAVTYFATYTDWLYVVVGSVNLPKYEESHLHTYDLQCTSSAVTATPTPTPTTVFVPSTGGTGGTTATDTPVATVTPIEFPSPYPTSTPLPPEIFIALTKTPTPLPPVIQFQPLPTATPVGGSTGDVVNINVTLYYDVNNSYTPELTEGVDNVTVFLFDSASGSLLSAGSTNETGVIRFQNMMTSGPVRLVVPFLGYNQVVLGNDADILLRIAPQPLPIGIP